jgi:membrane protease YdiL (CAAX protease family)
MKAYSGKQPVIAQGWLRAALFVICYFGLMVAAAYITGFINGRFPGVPENTHAGKQVLLAITFSIIISVAAVGLFRLLIDRQSVMSLGLSLRESGVYAGTGFFTGILVLSAGTLLLALTRNLQWTDIHFNGIDLFLCFGLMLIVAFYEELVFRGYLLNNLMLSLNKWAALCITALLFALAHAGNPGFTIIAFINIFLAGLLLGVNYIYTRNLWFGILLHFSWNFLQGPILGYDVSGLNLQSLLEQEIHGSKWLTGGVFGFEGSVVDSLLSLVTIIVLAWAYQKKFASARAI